MIGASTSGGSSAGQFDGMFGVTGDLALQRKIEKPTVTIEKVAADASTDAPADAASNSNPQNSVVDPSS